MEKPKVAAVFATMNRRESAARCVQALAAQTRPLDLVVVADNQSGDDTIAVLEQMGPLPFPMALHRMPENRGNAGGVEEAMEIAYSRGMDAVWILDDDSIPRPEALEALLEPLWRTDSVRHSIQIDPISNDLTWPMQVCNEAGQWHTVSLLIDLPRSATVETRNNWTGSLVPKEVRDKVGPVLGELFIRGEDEEYPWRFQQYDVSQMCVCGSILDHPGPPSLIHTRLFGKSIYYEPGLSDWKLYYKIRNMLWLQRKKRGITSMFALGIAYAWVVSRIDGFKRLPLVLDASSDGISGRLGKWKRHPF